MPVIATFYSGANGYREQYSITYEDQEQTMLTYQSPFNENFRTQIHYLCLSSQQYTVSANNIYNELHEESVENVWSETSYLRLDTLEEVPLYYFNQYSQGTKTIILHVYSTIASSTPFSYYFTNTPIANWYSYFYDFRHWPKACAEDFPTLLPYPTQHYLYYRYSYSFSSLQDVTIVNFRLYCQHGIQFYVNENEYYRARIEDREDGSIECTTSLSEPEYHSINLPMNVFMNGDNYLSVALYLPNETYQNYSFKLLMYIQKGGMHRPIK